MTVTVLAKAMADARGFSHCNTVSNLLSHGLAGASYAQKIVEHRMIVGQRLSGSSGLGRRRSRVGQILELRRRLRCLVPCGFRNRPTAQRLNSLAVLDRRHGGLGG